MREVCRAVERIDVPTILCARFPPAALFRDDVVIGKTRAKLLDDVTLGGSIGLGDDIGVAAGGGAGFVFRPYATIVELQQDGSGLASRLRTPLDILTRALRR